MSPLAIVQWAAGALAEGKTIHALKWLDAPAAWVTFLIVLAIAGFAALMYARENTPANGARRIFLGILRAAAIIAVLLVFYNLVETSSQEETRESWVVVMIDDSLSMSLKDRFSDRSVVEKLAQATGISESEVEEKSRMDLVKAALEKENGAFFKDLLSKNHVRVMSFSSRAANVADLGGEAASAEKAEKERAERESGARGPTSTAVTPATVVDRVEPVGSETAIGDALNGVMNATRSLRLAGIILITDGRNNAGALAPLKVAERLHGRGIPLYTVGVGNPEEPKDIAITDMQSSDVVIAGDVLPIRVTVKSQGFEGEEGHVELHALVDEEVAKSEPIQLQGKGASQDAAIRVKLEKPGEYTLAVEIPPQQGELLTDNNRRSKRIKVIDKKIKVLYVDGLPRWEFRYLRWGLIRDKNMEAQTFQVSADPDFVQDSTPQVANLAEIPKTKQELFQYHVIILGDVDPVALGDERMKLIKEFVEDAGGGLLVIAGQHYMPRAYAGTPIEGLLPVSIDPSDDIVTSSHPITESFRPKLTIDGQRHSIMQLENDPEQNLELWGGKRTSGYGSPLPGFYWYYRPRDKKRTAEVLAVHPDAQTQKQEPVPIFALQLAGAGTTFFSATDDVWRWRAGVGDRYTYRFWRQAIRFLSTGRLLHGKRFAITTDKAVYDLGEKIDVTAEVSDRNLRPSEEETQTAYMETPDHEVQKFDMTRPPRTPGHYEAKIPAAKVGTYKVWIAGGANPEKPEPDDDQAVRIFQVQVPVLEKSDPKMDETLLRQMASTKDRDRYVALYDVASLPPLVMSIPETSEVHFPEHELWDRWWVIVAIVSTLGVEWALRKRWKMM